MHLQNVSYIANEMLKFVIMSAIFMSVDANESGINAVSLHIHNTYHITCCWFGSSSTI